MRPCAFACLFATIAVLGSLSASGKEPDCSVARDPRRCEAQRAAQEACSGLRGEAHGACIRDALPPPDCNHAPNAPQCQAKNAAELACKEKHGNAHRKCLREQASAR
jgi:hypothetical protein